MQSFSIKRVLLESTAVIVIAATISMILVPLLNQRAVADGPSAAPTIMPRQPSLDALFHDFADRMALFHDFADRMALDQRLRTLEQQIQTLLNTAPAITPQQLPSAVPPLHFADRKVLDQRIRTLERQVQTLSNAAPTTAPQQPPIAVPSQDSADRKALDQQQIQTLSNTDERPVQTLSEKFPTSLVTLKQATAKYRHRRRHEIEGTAVARETGYANPGGRPGITKAPKATREYDEAGNEIR
jgi:hypothetical protein